MLGWALAEPGGWGMGRRWSASPRLALGECAVREWEGLVWEDGAVLISEAAWLRVWRTGHSKWRATVIL